MKLRFGPGWRLCSLYQIPNLTARADRESHESYAGLGFGFAHRPLFLDLGVLRARSVLGRLNPFVCRFYKRPGAFFWICFCLFYLNYLSRLDLIVIYITISNLQSHHISKITARIAARNLAPTLTLQLNLFLDARWRTSYTHRSDLSEQALNLLSTFEGIGRRSCCIRAIVLGCILHLSTLCPASLTFSTAVLIHSRVASFFFANINFKGSRLPPCRVPQGARART